MHQNTAFWHMLIIWRTPHLHILWRHVKPNKHVCSTCFIARYMALFQALTTGRCVCFFRISRELWVGVNRSVVVKSSNQVNKSWVNKEAQYSFFTFSTHTLCGKLRLFRSFQKSCRFSVALLLFPCICPQKFMKYSGVFYFSRSY